MLNSLIPKIYLFLFFFLIINLFNFSFEIDYNIKVFDTRKGLTKGQIANNKNGDMIVEYSSYSQTNYRYFYGVRQDGTGFFNGQFTKEIEFENAIRYESQNIFVYLNTSDDQTQYLLNFGANESYVELYNIEDNANNQYVVKKTAEVLGNSILSFVNSLLELNNDKKEYLLVYIYEQNYILQKFSISSLSLDNIVIKKALTSPDNSTYDHNRMVDAITFNNNILVFFVSGHNFYLNLFDFDLNLLRINNIDSFSQFAKNEGFFAKSISLIENKLLLLYYKAKNSALTLKLANYDGTTFSEYISSELSSYNFISNPKYNKLIKVNSQRCAFFALKLSSINPLYNNNSHINDVSNATTIF